MEEEDDRKNLYDVTELQNYDDQSGYKPGPMTDDLQYQATVSVGKFGTVILVVIALLIFLVLVILLAVTGITLTHLNTLPVCENSATSGAVTTTATNTEGNLPNCTVVYNTWADELVKNNTLLQTQIDQLRNTTNRIFDTAQDTAMKVDDIYSYSDANNTNKH